MRNGFVTVRTFLLIELLVFLCHVVHLDCEKILGQGENDEFDFDGLPGAQHEFKVYIPGSSEECFHQPIVKGAKFHVNFEALKGENYIDFVVRDPNWQVIESQNYKTHGQYSLDDAEAGTYAICIYTYSSFHSTLVYIYMVTFVMHEWVQYQHELGEVNILASNFSVSLTSVQEMVSNMMNSQAKARFHVIKDWYLVHGNNTYINRWSMLQCILIVAASIIQVYSVRRLFRTTNITPTTAKPRA